MTPPSEPVQKMFGSFGSNTSARWSGCCPFGGLRMSFVMSENVVPASVERTTAAPFEYGTSPKRSLYSIEPDSRTVSSCPGGEKTPSSYEHWSSQKLND